MKKLITLIDFCIKRCHVDWFFPDEKFDWPYNENLFIDYHILRNEKDSRKFIMNLIFKTHTEDKMENGEFLIEAELMGLFEFSEKATEDDMQSLIRINGGTILYGLLRGHLAGITGAFPSGGKYVLPSVYFHEIVPLVEKRKSATKPKPLRRKSKKTPEKKK